MRHPLLLALALPACGVDATATPDGLPDDLQAPPLQLTVPELYVGTPATFEVNGAFPGAPVALFASPRFQANGFCPSYLRGECVDLASPTVLAIGRADRTGHFQATVTVPPTVPANSIWWFQAGMVSGGAGYVSNARITEVYDAACPQTVADFWAEATAIRSCSVPADCGTQLFGTSCGCTQDWVARTGVDTTAFYALLADVGSCGVGLVSTCDCPPVNGFDCVGGQCTWDYQ